MPIIVICTVKKQKTLATEVWKYPHNPFVVFCACAHTTDKSAPLEQIVSTCSCDSMGRESSCESGDDDEVMWWWFLIGGLVVVAGALGAYFMCRRGRPKKGADQLAAPAQKPEDVQLTAASV